MDLGESFSTFKTGQLEGKKRKDEMGLEGTNVPQNLGLIQIRRHSIGLVLNPAWRPGYRQLPATHNAYRDGL